MNKKILIVEDEPVIITGLVDLLSDAGYKTVTASNGEQAFYLYEEEKPDIVLLDIMIPGMSGFDVCKKIRKQDDQTVVIMLTAREQEMDKVICLEMGADDYIVKPFGEQELLARIRAALRRTEVQPNKKVILDAFEFGSIKIDPKTLKGYKDDEEFPLSHREIELLKIFMEHDGEVIDRNMLLDKVWGIKYGGTTRTLDQHIAKLRQKIEKDPANPKHIQTVHGQGYRFNSK